MHFTRLLKRCQSQKSRILALSLSRDILGFWGRFFSPFGASPCFGRPPPSIAPQYPDRGPRAGSRMPRPGWAGNSRRRPIMESTHSVLGSLKTGWRVKKAIDARSLPSGSLLAGQARFASPDPVAVRFRAMMLTGIQQQPPFPFFSGEPPR